MANDLTLYDKLEWWSDDSPLALLRKLNPGRFRYFDQKVPSWQGLRVLDAGCGGGFTSEFLAARGAQVTGIDPSVASIDAAKLHAAEQKNPSLASIRYIVGSATELPFESGTFDAAVCVDVLEHIPRWPLALAELRRVLRPGGWLFFDTINRNPLSAFVFVPLLERTLGWIAPGTHDPKMFIKPPEMRLALEGMGFQNIHMTGFHVGLSLTKRQVTSFAGGPTSLMYIGRAQRT